MNKRIYIIIGVALALAGAMQAQSLEAGTFLAPSHPRTFAPSDNSFEPPYFYDFDSDEAFSLWTLIDGNGDGACWFQLDGRAWTSWSKADDTHADDWLVSPPISLKGGRAYTLRFKAYCSVSVFEEYMEVCLGQSPTVEGMTTTLFERMRMPGKADADKVWFSKTFTPDADGSYHVGFHNVTQEDTWMIQLDSIFVDAVPTDGVPAAATDLTAESDSHGAMTATVSFRAPTATLGGQPLESLTKVTVSVGGTTIHTFDRPQPGEQLSFTENDIADRGLRHYAVTAFNDEGYGPQVTAGVFVGLDVPVRPQNIRTSYTPDAIHLTWDAVPDKGENGGWVVPEETEYVVVKASGDEITDELSVTSDLHYAYPIATNEGDQDVLTFGVGAKNAVGATLYTATNTVVGRPYTLPLAESFAQQQSHYLWWIQRSSSVFAVSTHNFSSDDDLGSIFFNSLSDHSDAALNSGKLSLKGTVNPEVFYSCSAASQSDVALAVEVICPDGRVTELARHDFSQMELDNGWMRHKVSLADFTDEDYVVVSFHAYEGKSLNGCSLDNIVIRDVYPDDLSATLLMPPTATKGTTPTATVRVTNRGDNPLEGFRILLYDGDRLLADSLPAERLACEESHDYTFHVRIPSIDTRSSIDIRAEVVYDVDLNDEDNADAVTVELRDPQLPMPINLLCSSDAEGVALTWEAPEGQTQVVVEDFEQYAPFAIDGFGDWTTYDGNGQRTYTFHNLPFTHSQEPYAWISFDASSFGIPYEYQSNITPHSGNQYMASFCAIQGVLPAPPKTDHWLISPELSGRAQQIGFYAATEGSMGAEQLDIAVSRSGNRPEDFERIGTLSVSNVPEADGNWGSELTFRVPEGTRRFALIHASTDCFVLYIDDMSYETGSGFPVAYNVYRDQELMATVEAGEPLRVVDPSHAAATYSVTAVYADGAESMPVSFSNVPTSINEECRGNEELRMKNEESLYDLQGRLISRREECGAWSENSSEPAANLAPRSSLLTPRKTPSLKKGIYIKDGRKFVAK